MGTEEWVVILEAEIIADDVNLGLAPLVQEGPYKVHFSVSALLITHSECWQSMYHLSRGYKETMKAEVCQKVTFER